jgi:hypothetical protein
MKFTTNKEKTFNKKLDEMVKMKKKSADNYERYSIDRSMRIAEMNAYSFMKDYFCMLFGKEENE